MAFGTDVLLEFTEYHLRYTKAIFPSVEWYYRFIGVYWTSYTKYKYLPPDIRVTHLYVES
jgi:hypothetical protein